MSLQDAAVAEEHPTLRPWNTAKAVATYLDAPVESVYALRESGRLKSRPHGSRSWRFSREAVLEMEQAAKPTADDDARITRIVRREVAKALRDFAERLECR